MVLECAQMVDIQFGAFFLYGYISDQQNKVDGYSGIFLKKNLHGNTNTLFLSYPCMIAKSALSDIEIKQELFLATNYLAQTERGYFR